MPPDDDKLKLRSAAEALGLQYVETVPDAFFSQELLEGVPLSWARAQSVLPVKIDGKASLLISDPNNLEVQHKASLIVGSPLIPVAAPKEVIHSAIERFHAAGSPATDAPHEEYGQEPPAQAESNQQVSDLLTSDESAPATRFVNSVLLQAVREKASDIHFEPFAGKTAIRFRIDGVLYERATPPKGLEASVISRLKVMAGMDIAEKRLPQDGMAQAKVGQKSIDIRVSSIPVSDGERIVLRLLDRDDACLPMASLGMAGSTLERFRDIMRVPNGIIIVSGPTGSGKTTTLYAALGELDSARRNILTIEDPVEYRLPNIGQIQVKPKIGLTFASGLRHILRQDPDVILVGETRDPETAEIAVRASLTGHLVFTTLHTNDAPSAIMRLVDMGIPPYLLASSLRGALAQRLVRNLCPNCRTKTRLDKIRLPANYLTPSWEQRLLQSGVMTPCGCDQCIGGYKGRQGIFEIMTCTEEISQLIRKGIADGADLRKAALEAGMISMLDDALTKVEQGKTDLAEVTGVLAV